MNELKEKGMMSYLDLTKLNSKGRDLHNIHMKFEGFLTKIKDLIKMSK
jgi:hypothetical protein